MSTVGELYREGRRSLAEAEIESPAFDAACLFQKAFGLSRQERILRAGEEAGPAKAEKYRRLIRERADGRPLQYLLGEWPFCGLSLLVGEGVLIPREETELLVSAAAGMLKEVPQPGILDLCSGTGAVALALASLLPQAKIRAAEKYPAAFSYLTRNIARIGTDHVEALCLDVLDPGAAGRFRDLDAIVSNPPYVRAREIPALQQEVRREPAEALDGGADGLDFYRAIAELWLPALRPGGALCVECGEGQAPEIARILESGGLTGIRFHRDFGGIDRVVAGRKKN